MLLPCLGAFPPGQLVNPHLVPVLFLDIVVSFQESTAFASRIQHDPSANLAVLPPGVENQLEYLERFWDHNNGCVNGTHHGVPKMVDHKRNAPKDRSSNLIWAVLHTNSTWSNSWGLEVKTLWRMCIMRYARQCLLWPCCDSPWSVWICARWLFIQFKTVWLQLHNL